MAKSLQRTVNTTNAWVDSSLYVDCSTGMVSPVGPLDEVEIDASVMTYKSYERPATHLQVNYEALDAMAQSNPYKELYDNLKKAAEKFNS